MGRAWYEFERGEVLGGLLLPRCREAPLRALLRRLLDSGGALYREPWVAEWLGWDAPAEPGKGLPIGNLTSQWWGNLYLDGLDHFCLRELRVPAYQRYMDDITLFSDDRRELTAARERVAAWLRDERRLELKDPLAQPARTEGAAHYLGYRVTRAGLTLGPKARGRMRERLGARPRRDEGRAKSPSGRRGQPSPPLAGERGRCALTDGAEVRAHLRVREANTPMICCLLRLALHELRTTATQ